MGDPAVMVAAAFGSYLIGSIPTAYLAVRWTQGADIRRIGSGNVGATNAARVAGPGTGALVFLVDAAKGAAASVLPLMAFQATNGNEARALNAMRLLCGSVAVLGHNFPCWLRFQGGKGVATTLGAVVAVDAPAAGIAALTWALVLAASRYVSIASIAAGAGIPLAQWLLGRSIPEIGIGAALGALIIARHHGNLRRLRAGTEPRIR